MELPLPEELGRIVNGYAKPILPVKLLREYKDTMVTMNFSYGMPIVEAKLYGPDADQVMEALRKYKNAYLATKDAEEEGRLVTKLTHPKKKIRDEEEYRLGRITFDRREAEKEAMVELMRMVDEDWDAKNKAAEERMDEFHELCEHELDEE